MRSLVFEQMCIRDRYETILNKSYAEMAEYYETAIVPARVRAPQDKSLSLIHI